MKQTNLQSITLNAFPCSGLQHWDLPGFFACNIQWLDSETGERKYLDIPVTRENLATIQAAQRALVTRGVE